MSNSYNSSIVKCKGIFNPVNWRAHWDYVKSVVSVAFVRIWLEKIRCGSNYPFSLCWCHCLCSASMQWILPKPHLNKYQGAVIPYDEINFASTKAIVFFDQLITFRCQKLPRVGFCFLANVSGRFLYHSGKRLGCINNNRHSYNLAITVLCPH